MRWKEGSQDQGSAQLRTGVNSKYYLHTRELNTVQGKKDGEG